jgi:hypothetical protein
MLRTSFRRVSDDLTVAQAADMLGKSAPDSNSSALTSKQIRSGTLTGAQKLVSQP